MNKKSKLMGIGLQFFAEGSGDPGAEGAGGNSEGGAGGTGGSGGGTGGEGGTQTKTFTQEEVNRMLANEKRQGRQAALKALGLDPNDKDAEKKAKAILDTQKTQAEKDAEALTTEKNARAEAEAKALAAERKLAVLTTGCKAEFVEEVFALASAKVNDSIDFEAALKAVKEKCPAFFEGDGTGGDPGTGGGQGHRRQKQGEKPGARGAALAQSVISSNPTKNPYFND